MFIADEFRTRAAECAKLLEDTGTPSQISQLRRSRRRFNLLAQNEDLLADNLDRMIRSLDIQSHGEDAGNEINSQTAVAIEEQILRCLGAAVFMHWNTIPTKLQRELFDTAGSMGDLVQTAVLRGQIARFLHDRKNHKKSAS
jgi:hypothetical protein